MKTKRKAVHKRSSHKRGGRRAMVPQPNAYPEQMEQQRQDAYQGNDKRGPLEEGE